MRTKKKSGPGNILKFAAWALACAFSGVGLFAETTVTFERLGDLPGGQFWSEAYDVSADGSVVVGSSKSGDLEEAFRWENNAMIALGWLPMGNASFAQAISADGLAIVGNTRSTDSGNSEAFRWENGVMTGLGRGSCSDISGDGSVIVGANWRWEDGVMTDLDLPFSDPSIEALSYDGSVMVGHDNNGTAFRWDDGVMTELGPLPGDDNSEALGVSADGAVVVGYSVDSNGYGSGIWKVTPCLWENGAIVPLEGLPSSYPGGKALEVSGDGMIVVGTSGTDILPNEIVLWSKDNEYAPITLRSILEGQGLNVNDVTFTVADGERFALSSDGTTIVGGMNELGVNGTQAFRARIVDSPLDPLIGGTPIEGLPGWYRSDWFGFYNTDLEPWIFHDQHGWLYRWPDSTNDSMYTYDDAMAAWWWTSQGSYPSLYAFDPPVDNGGTDIGSEWLWYFEGPNGPRSFVVLDGASAGTYLFFDP